MRNPLSANFYLSLLILPFIIAGCNTLEKNEKSIGEDKVFFEGSITFKEETGLYGKLFTISTSYQVEENCLKREERLTGINKIWNNYAGLIINLDKDKVILYYSDITNKIKHSLSVKEYLNIRDSLAGEIKSPWVVDRTFQHFDPYIRKRYVKDSLVIEGFTTDYSKFTEGYIKQEVFDTRQIKIKRLLMEMAIPGIPESIHFPLRSDLKTIVGEINNDSITSSAKDFYPIQDTENVKMREDKNSFIINTAINLIKKGIDLNLHSNLELDEIFEGEIPTSVFSLSDSEFKEISDLDDFLKNFPDAGELDD